MLVVKGDRISMYGWRYLRHQMEHGELIQTLSDVPSTLRDMTALAKGYAPLLAQDFKSLSDSADFIPHLERLVTRLRQVDHQRHDSASLEQAFMRVFDMFGYRIKNQLVSKELDVEAIITGIRNFRRYVVELQQQIELIGNTREDVFNPKGIDRDRLIQHLDDAIESIRGSRIGNTEYGQNLILHLEKTRAEAASAKPSWKSIIGGIAVAAAIVSAVADAPGAKDAIQKAYSYIITGAEHSPITQENGLLLPVASRQETKVTPVVDDGDNKSAHSTD